MVSVMGSWRGDGINIKHQVSWLYMTLQNRRCLSALELNHEDLACLLSSAICDRRTLSMGETPNAAIPHFYLGWSVFGDRVQLQQAS